MAGPHETLDRLHDLLEVRLYALRDEPPHLPFGRRMRSGVCFLVCESFGVAAERALSGALAVELVHNFPILAEIQQHGGDQSFALAYNVLTEGRLPPDQASAALRSLSAACVTLCEGECLEMYLENEVEVGVDQYLNTVGRKTGALFGCAAELGAVLAGAPPSATAGFGDFGRLLGGAYQLRQDVLGGWGNRSNGDRPAGDVLVRRRGLLAVIALAVAAGDDRARLRGLYARRTPPTGDDARWLVRLFDRLGVRDRAETMIRQRFVAVRLALDRAAGSPDRAAALHALVDLIARHR